MRHELAESGRQPSEEDLTVLARWSSWGDLSEVFDESKQQWATERTELKSLVGEEEWRAAARTTINAHYTDPTYVGLIWQTLAELGFEGGRVLEPGAGSGTFIGLAPANAEMVGVELDPITAGIAASLYPQAQIRVESFADTRIPDGHFDAVVGNVPFANVSLHDPVHNRGKHSIHNHFIIKSLHLTRPGGLVAVLTSYYTLDSQNPAARREIIGLAELVGAVRLPSGAHRRVAGTEAITDLLILRRSDQGETVDSAEWEHVVPVAVEGGSLEVNAYFATNPEHILGSMKLGRGMYRDGSLVVEADIEGVGDRMAEALDGIVAAARQRSLTMVPRPARLVAEPEMEIAPSELWEGSIVPGTGGRFQTVSGGLLTDFKVPKTVAVELRQLVDMRDQAIRLLALEAESFGDSEELDTTRSSLRHMYESYVRRYGPLGRYKLRRTGRRNLDGEETYARQIPTAIRLLRSDPFGPVVLALERFDEQDQAAVPAELLDRRVVAPREQTLGVETPSEAMAVSMDRTGRIDVALIAQLLGVAPDDAVVALEPFAFTDPVADRLVPAPEYLSGDVRSKLDAAILRAETDPTLQRNVEALREVLPEDLGVEEISAQLGAVWISAEVHQQFLRELLRDSDVIVENPLPGMWEVRGGRQGILSTSEWGTPRRPAPDIAQAVMEQRTLIVYDTVEHPDGSKRQVLNPEETAAAQEKAQLLQDRFGEWVWEDPVRAQALVDEYNRRFNSIVLRDYSRAGDYLTFPGMASTFKPLPHQRAAVARMIAEPAAGLFHEVGAGKTAEMVMGAMEMKRIGLIRKPVVVVPNHMLEQFTREWLQIYPTARILAASSQDLTKEKRRMFVAKAATNDWDGILVTQGAFAKIPVSPETESTYIETQIRRVQAALHAAQGEDRKSVKRVQKHLLRLENKLKARLDQPRDVGVTFEETGIDYVIVDELHMYKNLSTESNIRDAAIEGSDRASDLHLKLEYLRSQGRDRIVTGATATPISNSITEAYVMQAYLRPDLLHKAGIHTFDEWAATFGTTVTQMEMAPTGNTFRMNTRFARFRNVPEMLRMWSVFADVKTAADLQLPTPDIIARDDGKRVPETRPIQPTAELETFIAELGKRADDVAARKVRPDEDNMLAISTDGRKAALDTRLVLPNTPTGPTKIDVAADAIFEMWNKTADSFYNDPTTGEPSLIQGALQLVFCDLGIPNPDKWNVYDELHEQLVQRGVPADQVRFIHEAKTDADKARLFAAARGGHIGVLIGSTEKMGVGTNVQARAVALHHLDCPWRPSDIAQREGRILRQGNQNTEVAIIRYVTEGSFDAYMWQGVERKAAFIAQVMRGSLDQREIEELDNTTLSASEAKAISSGNPHLLEQSTLQAEVSKLQRLERAHSRNETMLTATRERAQEEADQAQRDLEVLEQILPRLQSTAGDKFRIELFGTTYTSRTDAGLALTRWAQENPYRFVARTAEHGVIGKIAGFDIQLTSHNIGLPEVTIDLVGVPRSQTTISKKDFLKGGAGLVQRIENRANGIPTYIDNARRQLATAEQTITETSQRIGEPFRHSEALREARQRLEEVNHELSSELGRETPDEPSAEPYRAASDGVGVPERNRAREPGLTR